MLLPLSPLHLQIQNSWSYGENIDEELKTHPMLRPYKTFSEKVTQPRGPEWEGTHKKTPTLQNSWNKGLER